MGLAPFHLLTYKMLLIFFFFFLVDTFRALEVDSRADAPGYRIETGLDFEDGRYYEERLVSESDVEEVRTIIYL